MVKKILVTAFAIVASFSTKMWACWTPAEYEGATCFRIVQPYPDFDTAYRGSTMDETVKFWFNYLKKSVKADVIKNFFTEAPHNAMSSEEWSDNAFLLAIKRDPAATRYLTACLMMQGAFNESWYYDDQEECLDKATRMVEEMDNLPAAFEYRVALLKMRVYTAQKNYDAVAQVWNQKGQQCPDKALLNRMKGYYAGVLFSQERFADAMNIYAELGDQLSMRWCMSKYAGYDGIRKLAEQRTSDTDVALYYALQDYANYYCEQRSYTEGVVVDSDVQNDANRVRQFCLMKLDESKNDKVVWLSMVAWIDLMNGNCVEAMRYAKEAVKQKGTLMQKENAERILMLARVKSAPIVNDDKTLKQLAQDFLTLQTRAYNEVSHNTEFPSSDEYRYYYPAYCPNYCFLMDSYMEALQKYLTDHRLIQGNAVMLNLCDQVLRKSFEGAYSTWSDSWFVYLNREVSMEDMAAFYESVKSKKATDVFAQQLIKKFDADSQILLDLSGTKCLREGKYSLALNYFNQLSDSYVSSTNYRDYLATRTIRFERPFERTQRNEPDDENTSIDYKNVKAQFCQDMVNRINSLSTLSGDAKAKMEWEMAQMMFQASNAGDLWAISEFGVGCNEYLQPNKLCAQARVQLNNALKDSKSPVMTFDIYYGLALVPTGERFWSLEYDWDTQVLKYKFTMFHPARAAYEYLKTHRSVRDLTSTCDVLKYYAKQSF